MRKLLASALVTALFPSTAMAVIGPPISFSTGNSIYLVNPDGSRLTLLYRGGRGTAVQGVDLKRGGGEVAFVENHVLKVLAYDDSGRATAPPRIISLPCPVALSVDHNSADDSLAVKDGCAPNHIWRVAPGAMAAYPQPLITRSDTIGDVIWSRDGTRLYYELADGLHAYYAASGASQTVFPDHTMWSPTLNGDRLILAGTNNTYFIHDFVTGNNTPGCTTGQMIHYGNDDSQMVYRIPGRNTSFTVAVQNSNCLGGPLLLTRAGAYAGIDWAAP